MVSGDNQLKKYAAKCIPEQNESCRQASRLVFLMPGRKDGRGRTSSLQRKFPHKIQATLKCKYSKDVKGNLNMLLQASNYLQSTAVAASSMSSHISPIPSIFSSVNIFLKPIGISQYWWVFFHAPY